MPTYEYVCDACGDRSEAFQRMTELPLKICPHCQAVALRRLPGPGAAVMFKGEGFYETDYKKPEAKKKEKPGGAA